MKGQFYCFFWWEREAYLLLAGTLENTDKNKKILQCGCSQLYHISSMWAFQGYIFGRIWYFVTFTVAITLKFAFHVFIDPLETLFSKCLFESFTLFFFFLGSCISISFWFAGICYTFWVYNNIIIFLCPVYELQVSSPNLWFAFHSLNCVF